MCVSKLGMSTHANVVPALARRGSGVTVDCELPDVGAGN